MFFLKEKKSSVLLIHEDTPKETAIEMAKRKLCRDFIWRIWRFYKIRSRELLLEEPSLLQYSSGTTGEPKLIRRAWTEVDTEITAYNEALNCEVDEVPIVMAPVSHSYGLICGTLSAITREQACNHYEQNPKFALNIVRNTEKHIIYAVPLMLHIMGSFPLGTFQFHKIMTSGSPLPEALFYKLKNDNIYDAAIRLF